MAVSEHTATRPADEAAARVDLAALYRLAVQFGWTDVTSTHISARIPGDRDHYLLNRHDLMFHEISASNLVKMGFDGSRDREDGVLNLAGHIIHSGILSARPDVNFVIHSHTRAGIAVSAMPDGLLPLSQHAGFVLGTLATHPYQDSTAVADEGALLARDLGDNFAMLLENHGLARCRPHGGGSLHLSLLSRNGVQDSGRYPELHGSSQAHYATRPWTPCTIGARPAPGRTAPTNGRP